MVRVGKLDGLISRPVRAGKRRLQHHHQIASSVIIRTYGAVKMPAGVCTLIAGVRIKMIFYFWV